MNQISELSFKDIEEIFKTKKSSILNFIKKSIHNAEDAEDILSITFEEALKGRLSFKGENVILSWIFGIAHYVSINYYHSQKKHHTNRDLLYQLEWGIDDHPSNPQRVLESKEIISMLCPHMLKCVPGLNPTELDCNVILGVLMEEIEYKQAAVLLNMPLGTIRSRVSRTKENLMSLMRWHKVADKY